ncbi:MAG: DUF1385 domain-containing protein [Chloroflexota bacterium]
MSTLIPKGIRVGGSALPDGVMMLTPLAVAIARETSSGSFSVESFPLPERRPNFIEKLPFVRILPKLFAQMSLVVRGWKPSKGRRLPIPMLGAVLAIGLISSGLNLIFANLSSFWHAVASSVLQLLLFFSLIAVTRAVPRFGRIWRFHGGEHQAIAAYEADLPLTPENASTRSLYHPRCGTNLATLSMVIMIPGMVFGSLIAGFLGYVITVAVPLAALCVAFEIVMLGQTRLRAVLWPGLAFQRLTVARPGHAESIAGITALQAVLVEHVRVAQAREAVALFAAPLTQAGLHPAE